MSDPEESTSPLPMWVRCRRFLLNDAAPGLSVLDVGCGEGALMRELVSRGCHARGVEISETLIQGCRDSGLDVVAGTAETLPFPDETFDGIVCSVVLPYTDENKALAEFYRVLKPGGTARMTGHGIGYACDFILNADWRRKIYGARMLANTAWYTLTATRLPGVLGDTLCERVAGMQALARRCGFEQIDEEFIGMCCGSPRFLAQAFRKPMR